MRTIALILALAFAGAGCETIGNAARWLGVKCQVEVQRPEPEPVKTIIPPPVPESRPANVCVAIAS